jgi:cleavage and polyadenylation specificity factor subunit 2
MFTFSPLQGALTESTASQSLLELDGGVKVLIDVGWDETFDVEKLRDLEKYVVAFGRGEITQLGRRTGR